MPAAEIARIRDILNQEFHTEPHPYLRAGRRVRVKDGPLAGMEGIIVRRKNANRFVVNIESIQRAVAVEVEGLGLDWVPWRGPIQPDVQVRNTSHS